MGIIQKETVRLLAIQMEALIGEFELNIDTMKNLLKAELNKFGKVDFVFLPEVWTSGWECPAFADCAENIETAKSVEMLKIIAKKYHTNIRITL